MLKSWLHLFSWVGTVVLMAGCRSGEEHLTPIFTHLPDISTNTPFFSPVPSPTQTAEPIATVEPTTGPTTQPAVTFTHTPIPSQTPTLESGATQISPVDGMVLVYIPAGEFLMGSADDSPGSDADEKPQHPVYLDAYWMDQTVVTNAMYAAFLNDLGNKTEGRSTWLDAGDGDVLLVRLDGEWQPQAGYEGYPVVEVTWYGAQAYCQWAGRNLATEAEWEKAARGTTNHLYPWGDEVDCLHAQYANCGGSLLPVGAHPEGASPYGVLGLAGNVWEWIADWYSESYYSISPYKNPTGPMAGETRVLRGGAWEYDWKHIRTANRRHNGSAVSMHDYGFRCAMRADP